MINIYNIQIMGKQQCTLFSKRVLNKDYIIISINDTDSNTVVFKNPRIKDVLKLTFDDITAKDKVELDKIEKGNDLKVCTIKDIIKIKDFVDKWKDSIRNIIVHCTAGVSRSGAIGCILSRYLNGEEMTMFQNFSILPNKYIYEVACKVFDLTYSEQDLDRKYKVANAGTKNMLKNYGITLDDLFPDEERYR